MTMNRKLFAKGFRHGIPIGLGYLSVAFTFGMKAVADGLSPLEALLISMTNVTSAGQFAGLPLILAQASYLEVALTQLIINLRYALMSLCFRYVPMLSQVSSGFVIIICAIAASALGAWLFPVQEEETKAGDAQ